MVSKKRNRFSWILVYTKPKQEVLATKNLERQKFGTFLPLIANKTKKTKNISIEPIFPRYIFIRVNYGIDNLSSIKSTKGVSHPVKFGEEYAIVSDSTIELIKSRLGKDNIYYPSTLSSKYQKGDKLKVNEGSFSGMDGIFLSSQSNKRIRILLNFLKKQTIVELSKDDIEKNEIVETFKL